MKRSKVTGLRRRESWQALPFLLPSLLGLCLFYLFPPAETVRASFMDPLRSRAVGWGNYRALFQNTAFRLAVRNTCRFLCICIPALLAVSLLCAVLLGAAKRRAVFFKSVLLLPYAIPVASIVVLWRALFSGKGLVNGLLVGLGCRPVDFMGSSAAFWVLIFTYLWRNNGYDMLLWLAGLETIPRPLYEAAAVDGATPFQTFVFITLPNLLPTVVLTTILSLVNSFKVFREAYLVAGNYPQESIYLLPPRDRHVGAHRNQRIGCPQPPRKPNSDPPGNRACQKQHRLSNLHPAVRTRAPSCKLFVVAATTGAPVV
jgi:multiple sugar transport system permease protein